MFNAGHTSRLRLLPVLRLVGSIGMLVPVSAGAMELEQMREIEGIRMMDARMSEVLDAYALPARIQSLGSTADRAVSAVWRGTVMKLPAGDWEVVYERSGNSSGRRALAWHNSRSVMPPHLGNIKRLVLKAKGNMGILTVRRAPQKTTYDIPNDPFQSHKVIGVRIEYLDPVPIKEIIRNFGSKFESIEGGAPAMKIRYWVLHRQGEMPFSLYAVDFELGEKQEAALSCAVNGMESDDVLKKFQEHLDLWERNLYD